MSDPTPIDIEAIMQQIRQQILDNKAENGEQSINVKGKRLPPEFFEHLYHASLVHDQLAAKVHVTPVNIPIIGRGVEWARGKLHQLVIFYVNRLAYDQMEFNRHMLQAVSILSEALEQSDSDDA